MKIRLLIISVFFLVPFMLSAQEDVKVRLACIAFYNLENLFDTINDPNVNDEEFLPDGTYQWTSERYLEKLQNLSLVIDKIGNKYNNQRPAVLGICEIENISVVKDLINTELLKPFNYGIVHYDSPDRRGVDVGLIYQKSRFTVLSSASYTLKIEGRDDFYTRDQLLVTGILDGDTMSFIVNHWPSRRGGQKASAPLRNAAADLNRFIVDSILNVNPNAKIVVMGDLNDDPDDVSVLKHLRAKGKRDKLQPGELYNTMWDHFKNGVGSLAYRGQWNLFDMIIISQGLLNTNKETYELFSAHIFNDNFLISQEGRYAGYPYRTYSGGSYIGGYSDHLPTYIVLIKKAR
jgi:predicted extracellular nuclease